MQPIASADVVAAVVAVATGKPLQGIWSVAGPDVFHLDELGRVTLAAQHDARTVVTDDKVGLFGPSPATSSPQDPTPTSPPRTTSRLDQQTAH